MSWISCRFQPPAAPEKSPRDDALEGLRGLCAFAVLSAHAFLTLPVLDPVYVPPGLFAWFDFGGPSVLIFFALSGYVIGLTNRGPASAPAIRAYLARRAWRLVPLNTLAVLISWALWHHESFATVAAHLLFLQNRDPYPWIGELPILANNAALWSLNFEALYYLLFLLIWRWPPRTLLLLLALALPVAAQVAGLPIGLAVAAYAAGACWWLAGLAVAWFTALPEKPCDATPWVAAFAGTYAVWVVGPFRSLALLGEFDSMLWLRTTSPHRLDFVAVTVWLLLAVTGRAPALQRRLGRVCVTLATVVWLIKFGVDASSFTGADGIAALALVAAWTLLTRPFALTPLRRIAPLGTISFAVYLLGTPLQIWLCTLLPGFSGTPLTFTVRLAVHLTLTVAAAWWLERRVCPWLKRRLTTGATH